MLRFFYNPANFSENSEQYVNNSEIFVWNSADCSISSAAPFPELKSYSQLYGFTFIALLIFFSYSIPPLLCRKLLY